MGFNSEIILQGGTQVIGKTLNNVYYLGHRTMMRAQDINERLSFGHREINTIGGKKNKHEPIVLTLTERLPRYQIVLKISDKTEASNELLIFYPSLRL